MPVSGLVVTLSPPPPASPPESPPQSPVMRQSRLAGVASPAHTESAHTQTPPPHTAPTHAAVIEQIQQHPRFQVGALQDNRLPVVIDTTDKQEDKDCWAWLNSLPGVHHVDVAFIHFEDEDAFEHQSCSANTQRLIAAPTIGET